MPPYSQLPDRFRGEPGGEFSVERTAAIAALLGRHRVDVLLTGKGGDIVFGGPDVQPYHLADMLVEGRWAALAREAIDYQRRHPDRRGWLHWLLQYALRPARQHRAGRLLKPSDPREGMPLWLDPGWLRRHAPGVVKQWAPPAATPGQQYFWQEIFGQTLVLWTPERLSYPAETRHPLYHLPLVEFMAGLDHRERRTADDDRILQRRMLKGLLPEEVRTRRSKDGIQKQREIAFTASPEWHRILLDRPRIVERGWVDPAGWREEVERARIGMNVSGRSFDVACLFEAWLRSIEAYAPPAAPPLEAAAAPPDRAG